jgi:hypothetical protein
VFPKHLLYFLRIIYTFQTSRRHIPKDSNLCTHRPENFISRVFFFSVRTNMNKMKENKAIEVVRPYPAAFRSSDACVTSCENPETGTDLFFWCRLFSLVLGSLLLSAPYHNKVPSVLMMVVLISHLHMFCYQVL